MAKKWTPEEDELLLKLRGEGLTSREIAIRIKRTSGAIRMRLGILDAPQIARKWTTEEKELAWQLREAGHSNKYIAKQLQRTASAIATFFARDERNHYDLSIPKEK